MVNPDYVNGRGQWSRANQRGYTMDWREAGRFSRQEAEETAAGSHGKYTAVPLADISEPNAEAHGRAVARTVQPLVGDSESGAE